MRQVNVAVLGAGTVGGGVVDAIRRNGRLMASRLGIAMGIHRLVVRDARKRRDFDLNGAKVGTDWREAVVDPRTDIVVELVGGTTTAREMILAALRAGKPVVTANKALLSAHGEELFAAAREGGANLYYEASVAGGIPIIKVMREALIGNRVTAAYGILNGTCNYILTRMRAERAEFDAVLKDAQRLGYAEADPSLDVDGVDALHKAGILASLAHGFWVDVAKVSAEGIRSVTPQDMDFSGRLGYTIKLLAAIKIETGRAGRGKVKGRGKGNASSGPCISVSVCPTLVPNHHVLASVSDVFNAVFVRGDVVGDTLYYGRGAGRSATASSVLSDLADAALDLRCGQRQRLPPFVPHERFGTLMAPGEVVSSHYLRLTVTDRPGVLARIASMLAKEQIGISSVIQPEGHEGSSVPLIFMLHNAARSAVDRALKAIRRLPVVTGTPALFRVETFE